MLMNNVVWNVKLRASMAVVKRTGSKPRVGRRIYPCKREWCCSSCLRNLGEAPISVVQICDDPRVLKCIVIKHTTHQFNKGDDCFQDNETLNDKDTRKQLRVRWINDLTLHAQSWISFEKNKENKKNGRWQNKNEAALVLFNLHLWPALCCFLKSRCIILECVIMAAMQLSRGQMKMWLC